MLKRAGSFGQGKKRAREMLALGGDLELEEDRRQTSVEEKNV